MSMLNDIVWKTNDENCVSNAEKVKNCAERFLEGHWTFLGPGSRRKVVWTFYPRLKRAMELDTRQNDTAIQRGLVILYSNVSVPPSRGILKQKKGKTSIHFDGDSLEHRTLVLNSSFCKKSRVPTEPWRIGVINSVLQKMKRDQRVLLWTTRSWSSWNQKKYNSWYLFRKERTENRIPERVQSFDELAGQIQLTPYYLKRLTSNILLQPGNGTKFDQIETTDGE